MEITLNHTIVPSFNNVESAKFYERIFGFKYIKEWGHFAVVKVNSHLTLDFSTKEKFDRLHYAFKVTDKQFDEIFTKIKAEGLEYGSDPGNQTNMKTNEYHGGRGLYFKDPNKHTLEIITTDYILD